MSRRVLNRQEFPCPKWNFLEQGGIFLPKCNPQAKNGFLLHKIEISCSKQNFLAENGTFLQKYRIFIELKGSLLKEDLK